MRNLLFIFSTFLLTVLIFAGCSDKGKFHENPANLIAAEKLSVYESRNTFSEDEINIDIYLEEGRKEYQNRRSNFFDLYNSTKDGDIHSALVQLYNNQEPSEEGFISAIDKINKREDCADFRMIGLIRFIYQFPETSLVRTSPARFCSPGHPQLQILAG